VLVRARGDSDRTRLEQRVLEVVEEVGRVFDADTEADQILRKTALGT
jgi:hypothetical protein